MARTPQDITDAELAVMQVLWDEGPVTIRRITDVLYPGGSSAHYATVQKLLERLERNKEFVGRDRSGPVHVFAARVYRDELIGRKLRSVAEQLCGGSMTPLLTTLVQNQKLSAKQLRMLRDLIDELDESSKTGKKKRR